MKKIVFLSLAMLIITQPGCKDNCKDNEAPEIEFGLLAGGNVEVRSLQTGYVVTSEWEGLGINVQVNKVYCNGSIRGPFEESYTIDKDGVMLRSGIGYWSFRMDNRNDYMRLKFFCGGKEIGSYSAFYDMLAPSNGGIGYLQFKIELEWDYAENDLASGKVTLQ